jgi:cellulose synthase/poly-beta-1,6-N-acetylglucosamine synthase-like glycosyltransferase
LTRGARSNTIASIPPGKAAKIAPLDDRLLAMHATVIVIPCYNEAARLKSEEFVSALRDYPRLQFLFVDDGSSDGTDRVLAELAACHPDRLHWLKLPQNQGKAEAVRQGLLQAFQMRGEFVGFLDADLATPIAELVPMSAPFEDPDVLMVMASRVAMLGRAIDRSTWRHYTGRIFATFASLLLGLRVYDTQCGAKLLRNTAAVHEVFADRFMSSWAFDVEILARLLRLERRGRIPPVTQAVVEVPLRRWTDIRGSKISFADSVIATSQLLLMWWRYRE